MKALSTISLVSALAFAGACHHRAPAAAPVPTPAPATPTAAAQVDTTRHWTDADAHFMSGMIGHHAQAILMSQMAPTHGASATIQRLAARIINAQQDEIASMQNWLRDRGLRVPELHVMDGVPMDMSGDMAHMSMPGMLTADQMRQLDAARGADFDRLFLTFMIQHHTGAVTMVQQLFGTNGAALDQTVFKLASDVSADQTTEIDRMQQMLAAMGPSPSR